MDLVVITMDIDRIILMDMDMDSWMTMVILDIIAMDISDVIAMAILSIIAMAISDVIAMAILGIMEMVLKVNEDGDLGWNGCGDLLKEEINRGNSSQWSDYDFYESSTKMVCMDKSISQSSV